MNNHRATVKDVAKHAGVSIATVSHVINNTRYVSPEVCEKVEQAMAAVNYIPNNMARALRSDKTNTIGVLIPDITNPFFATIVKTLEEALGQKGYSMLLCHSADSHKKELEQLEVLHAFRVDGIIIVPVSMTFDYSTTAVYSQCPMVFIDRRPRMSTYSGVFINFRDVCRKAVEQLILAGHTSIGYLMGSVRFSSVEERQEGYLDALAKHNIPVRQEWIVSGPRTEEAGYEYMRYFLQNTDVTAVFVANRSQSLGAVRCLNEMNIDVPGRMAIICLSMESEVALTRPPLTSVYAPLDEVGNRVAELLLRRIAGEAPENEQIVIAGGITPRSSY